MTITDAIPRLLKLDGLVLPDGRVLHCIALEDGIEFAIVKSDHDRFTGWDGARLYADSRPDSYENGDAAFLLVDVVEAIHPGKRLWLGGTAKDGYLFSFESRGDVTVPLMPTMIEAVLETAVQVMEAYAESQKEASE